MPIHHDHLQLGDRLIDDQPFAYGDAVRAADGRVKLHARAILCMTPKSGSTAWLALLLKGLAMQGWNVSLSESPHGQHLPYKASTDPTIPLSQLPRLMLVRHPASRLLSGFLGKAVTRKIHVEGWDPRSGFPGFVQVITNSTNPNKHFLPQSRMCGLGKIPPVAYTYLRAEELGVWYRKIICLLGLQGAASSSFEAPANGQQGWMSKRVHAPCAAPPCCFVRTSDCGCAVSCSAGPAACDASLAPGVTATFGSFNDATARLGDYYDERLARQVNEWARRDLELFGYAPWRPGMEDRAVLN